MSEKEERVEKKEERVEKKEDRKKPDASPPIASLTDMVDRTAERISFLKKQQEDLKKQKADLEELRRQREELDAVKREVLNNLERGIAVLDREESDLKRRHTLVRVTRDDFDAIVTEIRGIREETWREEDLKNELGRALAVVAKARREYTAARGKVDALSTRGLEDEGPPVSQPAGFSPPSAVSPGETFRRGLAFWLPAALLAVLVAIVIRLLAFVK
ncbi:MAG: hypothetical protein V1789_09290 [PVC group bacterium]